ncbi:MAG: aminopeptidase P family protein [Ruminococcaceae bacterium]|nr:aminopeptidase P family protein [Oscillospiraceae bacterium]
MAYYNKQETQNRIDKVVALLNEKDADIAVIYFDELNVANGWYLTGWCGQFEKGAVLVGRDGTTMLLGGPESEPFAKQSSAISDTRCFKVFMVPDEEYPLATIIGFPELFAELNQKFPVKKVGLVGTTDMPYAVHQDLVAGFAGCEIIDLTDEYLKFRYVKSDWEVEQARTATRLCHDAYKAMAAKVKAGAREFEVAAAGEAVCRANGANSFAYQTIVGSGVRSNAVVPTATDKVMENGEMVMLGIAPRINGYAGTFGHTVPVSGEYTPEQKKCLTDMIEVMQVVKGMLKIGNSGRQIDAEGRKLYDKGGYLKYIVCPFAHTMGLMEAEAPFFGPNSVDILEKNMIVNVDVSFFGHPTLNGLRVETCYVITENGAEPLCPEFEKELFDYVEKH